MKITSRVTTEATVVLSEEELRALYALTAYGDDAFLKGFYSHHGEACLKPHEDGLKLLFSRVRDEIPPVLKKVDEARKFLASREYDQIAKFKK